MKVEKMQEATNELANLVNNGKAVELESWLSQNPKFPPLLSESPEGWGKTIFEIAMFSPDESFEKMNAFIQHAKNAGCLGTLLRGQGKPLNYFILHEVVHSGNFVEKAQLLLKTFPDIAEELISREDPQHSKDNVFQVIAKNSGAAVYLPQFITMMQDISKQGFVKVEKLKEAVISPDAYGDNLLHSILRCNIPGDVREKSMSLLLKIDNDPNYLSKLLTSPSNSMDVPFKMPFKGHFKDINCFKAIVDFSLINEKVLDMKKLLKDPNQAGDNTLMDLLKSAHSFPQIQMEKLQYLLDKQNPEIFSCFSLKDRYGDNGLMYLLKNAGLSPKISEIFGLVIKALNTYPELLGKILSEPDGYGDSLIHYLVKAQDGTKHTKLFDIVATNVNPHSLAEALLKRDLHGDTPLGALVKQQGKSPETVQNFVDSAIKALKDNPDYLVSIFTAPHPVHSCGLISEIFAGIGNFIGQPDQEKLAKETLNRINKEVPPQCSVDVLSKILISCNMNRPMLLDITENIMCNDDGKGHYKNSGWLPIGVIQNIAARLGCDVSQEKHPVQALNQYICYADDMFRADVIMVPSLIRSVPEEEIMSRTLKLAHIIKGGMSDESTRKHAEEGLKKTEAILRPKLSDKLCDKAISDAQKFWSPICEKPVDEKLDSAIELIQSAGIKFLDCSFEVEKTPDQDKVVTGQLTGKFLADQDLLQQNLEGSNIMGLSAYIPPDEF